jgi:hypothetical protein
MDDIVAGIGEGMVDVTRAAIADFGDTYQEVLQRDSGIRPPDGHAGDMVTVTETALPDPKMTDAQLQSLVDAQQHEREQSRDLGMDSGPVQPRDPGMDMA